MIVYYKDKFLIDSDIKVNENLFRGVGVFETIKFINHQLIFFNEHMDRLFSNNHFFNFNNINKNNIYKTAINTISKNNLKDGLLKIIVLPIGENFSDMEYYIFIRSLPKINSKIVKIKFYSESNYPILRFKPAYKSLSYMGNMLAIRDANADGAFEPIFYNKNKIITEGAIRNIFFIKDNIIYTPNLNLGVLDGVTRTKVLELAKKLSYKVSEASINYSNINNMDEAFLTSTAVGIIPCYWNNWSSDYPVTLNLKKHYNQIIKIQ